MKTAAGSLKIKSNSCVFIKRPDLQKGSTIFTPKSFNHAKIYQQTLLNTSFEFKLHHLCNEKRDVTMTNRRGMNLQV